MVAIGSKYERLTVISCALCTLIKRLRVLNWPVVRALERNENAR